MEEAPDRREVEGFFVALRTGCPARTETYAAGGGVQREL